MVKLKTSLAKGSALLAMAAMAVLPDAFSQSSRERFFLEQFLGEPQFEVQQIFTGERFPNVVVTGKGTVLATWGRQTVRVRRSEDGGATWGSQISIGPGVHGGGVTVDERTGNIFAFVEDSHPPAPLTVYRSSDDGRTWQAVEVTIHADPNDEVPSMHMNERGITLRHGEHAGRLLRPARVYMGADSYNSAIYSDDGGQTWHASAPFPVPATGEGAVAELSDGRIYYNSRRSRNSRMRWIAWSHDGGETWVDPVESDVLPDGPQNVDYGLMAGLVRLPLSGYDILLFSNVDSPGKPEGNTANWSERRRGTVWASFDGGETWPISRLVYEGPFAYSSLAAGRAATPSQGKIFLQFEGGPNGPHSDGHIVRFNLSWMMQGLIDSATGTLDRAKAMLEGAEIGDEPGQHPQWAATRLEKAIDALEEALEGISFPELIEKPERIRDLQGLEAELEQEMVQFEGSDGLPVPPADGFGAWREIHFTPDELADPALSGPMGSIAADRITNFIRYAFGLDPTEPALRRLPNVGLTSNSGIDFLKLTYRRLREVSDILYLVEAASEPGVAWTPLGPDREIAVMDNGDGTNSVTVRDTEPVTESNSRFMRLRVELVE